MYLLLSLCNKYIYYHYFKNVLSSTADADRNSLAKGLKYFCLNKKISDSF